MISLTSYSIYLGRCIMSLMVAAFLLTFRNDKIGNRKYKFAHLSISAVAIIDAAIDIWACWMISHDIQYFHFHWIWYPVYYVEWMILGFGVLKLIESKRYWAVLFPPYLIYVIFKESQEYIRRVDNNYVGSMNVQEKDFAKCAWIFYAAYIFLNIADLVVADEQLMDNVIMCLTSLWVVASSISLMNMQPDKRVTLVDVPAASEAQPASPAPVWLDKKVGEWENSPAKHYCIENITLQDVADELRVNPRILSAYINSMRKMTFSTWINTLRINEIIRILKENKVADTLDIIVATGFQSRSSMARVIKQVTGKTLTDLRAEA